MTTTNAKERERNPRGVFERPPKSGVWWILFYADGKRHREKVGRKSDAIKLYQKRKSEAHAHLCGPAEKLKMPVEDLMRQCNGKTPPTKALVKGLAKEL